MGGHWLAELDGRRVTIVDGTARPADSTQATWGKAEVADRPAAPPERDPFA